MPATTQAKHPKGYIINFFEDTHKYTSEINAANFLNIKRKKCNFPVFVFCIR